MTDNNQQFDDFARTKMPLEGFESLAAGLNVRINSSVNFSTHSSSSLKHEAACQSSTAFICCSVRPTCRAAGTCWVHSYTELQSFAVLKIASSRSFGSMAV